MIQIFAMSNEQRNNVDHHLLRESMWIPFSYSASVFIAIVFILGRLIATQLFSDSNFEWSSIRIVCPLFLCSMKSNQLVDRYQSRTGFIPDCGLITIHWMWKQYTFVYYTFGGLMLLESLSDWFAFNNHKSVKSILHKLFPIWKT